MKRYEYKCCEISREYLAEPDDLDLTLLSFSALGYRLISTSVMDDIMYLFFEREVEEDENNNA